MTNRTALVSGATGLIGNQLLRLLLEDDDYARVIVFVRRPLGWGHKKLEQHIVDFDSLEEYAALATADDVFCCLGTTRSQAGSEENFRRVDCDYVIRLARVCRAAGASQFLVVSALGAALDSKFFYNRVKAEMEQGLSETGYPALVILRPSLLLGKRLENRLGEDFSRIGLKAFDFALRGRFKRYRPIEAALVARAMQRSAKQGLGGIQILESENIRTIAAA
jgi:uncharacterized protein YbjT (DUF2867 family)